MIQNMLFSSFPLPRNPEKIKKKGKKEKKKKFLPQQKIFEKQRILSEKRKKKIKIILHSLSFSSQAIKFPFSPPPQKKHSSLHLIHFIAKKKEGKKFNHLFFFFRNATSQFPKKKRGATIFSLFPSFISTFSLSLFAKSKSLPFLFFFFFSSFTFIISFSPFSLRKYHRESHL